MAHAMLGLMNDRDALKRMGLAGRARVERRFSLERMIDGIEEVYRSVLRTC
jgi:glycosyltransferase involved in cell wall biosynthesis